MGIHELFLLVVCDGEGGFFLLCICLSPDFANQQMLSRSLPAHTETREIRMTALQGQWPVLKVFLEFKFMKLM